MFTLIPAAQEVYFVGMAENIKRRRRTLTVGDLAADILVSPEYIIYYE